MSFHATDAGFSVCSDRLSKFRNHLMSSVCAGLIIAAAGPSAHAQQVPGKYFNADGSRTNDLEKAAASWRTPEFLKDHALAGVRAEYAYAHGITGKGIKIGEVDSGILANHPQLQGQFTPLKVEGTYGLDGDRYDKTEKGKWIWKKGDKFSVSGNYDPLINDSHGTAAAGEMVGRRDGLEMHGIAFDAHLYSANSGGTDNTLNGPTVDYEYFKEAYAVLSRNAVRVVNSSWGQAPDDSGENNTPAGMVRNYKTFSGKKTYLDSVAEVSQQYSTIQTWANGNSRFNNPDTSSNLPYFRPEIEQYWISVTGVDKDGKSDYDRCGVAKYWCMAGPTIDIYSTSVGRNGNTYDHGHGKPDDKITAGYTPEYNGTSAAAPNVTTSLALVMQRFPYLDNSQARNLLFTTATHLTDKRVTNDNPNVPNDVFGWGRPNLEQAMNGPRQFLGRVEANLSTQVNDIWSNDISQVALDQRKTEETKEKADWATKKASEGWQNGITEDVKQGIKNKVIAERPIMDIQATTALITARYKALDLINFAPPQTTKDKLAAATEVFNKLDAKMNANPDAVALWKAFVASNPNTTIPRAPQFEAFKDKPSGNLKTIREENIQEHIDTALNQAVFEYAFMENTRVPYLTKKLADPSAYLGGLTKSGAGSLWLTGKNSYRGDTIVNGGELGIGTGGSIISAAIINNTGLLTVDGKTAAVTANPGGRLKVNAPGVTGAVTLNGGFASVDGTSGATEINTGGELGGIGIVGSLAVHTGGMVSPGNSIGTLHVAGPASFDKATGLTIQVAADGRSDRLDVKGKATLLGGVLIVAPESSKAPLSPAETLALLGKTYTVLTAEKGITGRFEAATPDYYFIGASLAYAQSDVKVSLGRNGIAFADAGKTENQKAAATGVESLGHGNPLYDTIAVTTLGDNLPEHFDALSGEVHASLQAVLVEDSRFVRDAAANRIRAAFGNMAGGKAAAAPVLAYGPDAKKGAAGDAFVPLLPAVPTTALWGEAYGSRSHADRTSNASAYSRNTGGFVTGFDGVIADTWRFGLLAGYGNTSVHTDRGRASADSYQVGVYGGTRIDALTLSLGTSLAHHEIDTRRKVVFGGINDSNTADYTANTVQLFGEAAYRIDTAYAALEPFAAAAYTHLKTAGFTETGGITALSGSSGTTDLTTTTLGLRASHRFALSEATVLTAHGMAGWRHAFGDTTPEASLAFASGGQAFAVSGSPIASDTALVEAGLDFGIGKATTLGISYTGQFSQQTRDNAVKADLTVRF
ncbi:autotransporter domain-containing protein [Phyllobacterium meliloti]|uniref:autotransporter domain-containing protein n=1 Tax=Phyllobacterium meliloti TaxID=555317 RepID=UPI001D154AC3|nr:autotransporter domain-containing protein [Phyllobacterium sp. T1293]UGX87645.1 autotransporter domain-containing protein [Phyllobacterium sp. T1293]